MMTNYFKKSNLTIQTAVLKLGHTYKTAPLEQPNPSVKLLKLSNISSGWDHTVRMSSMENWADGNIWLLSLPKLEESEFISKLSELHLDYPSRVFLFQFDFKSFDIYEVYKISRADGEVQMLTYGNWSVGNGLILSEENIWRRRIDLKQKHFM